jgi:hypothetical protein
LSACPKLQHHAKLDIVGIGEAIQAHDFTDRDTASRGDAVQCVSRLNTNRSATDRLSLRRNNNSPSAAQKKRSKSRSGKELLQHDLNSR